MDYNYIFFKTDKKNSFEKSIIQSVSKQYANDEDVIGFFEDILSFFLKKDVNYNEDSIYNYIINKRKDLSFLTIPRESKNIYDLYFKYENEDKNIYPLFSKKIKKEIEQNSIFFSSFDYKYLDFYIKERIPKFGDKLVSVSIDFVKKQEYKYDLINDVLSLNIILLDQNLNYYTTYENSVNTDYAVLKKDNDNYFNNIFFTKDDEETYILNKHKNKELIEYLENNTQSKYKNITEGNSLDYILKNIENSVYSLEDFTSRTKTMYKDNKT